MRSKNAIRNVASSIMLQLLKAVEGLLVARLILKMFGSNVNGLVSSIVQFLSYVSLLEAGVGGVVRAELFKPLAEKNDKMISEIIGSTKLYFKRIACIFGIYALIIAVAYPFVVQGDFSWGYVFTLVIIISISTMLEYLFCMTYINLISADQKVWLIYNLNCGIVILNIIVIYMAVGFGAGIHLVKLCGLAVYLVKPVFYSIYVKRHYNLVKTGGEYKIKQKWNGMVHNAAQFIHSNTDITIITLLISLSEVSVYAVYYAVASGVERIITSVSVGCAAGIGDIVAREEKHQLKVVTDLFEFVQSSIAAIAFTVTGVMIVPFVKLYTSGVADVDYIRPFFAYMLVVAEILFCIRSVYSTIILNAGHYKQTQINAIMEAVTNIVVSLLLVGWLGIIGVAIGTAAGMLVRIVLDIIYLKNNIVYRSPIYAVKCLATNAIIVLSGSVISFSVQTQIDGWGSWILNACASLAITTVVALAVYRLLYPEQLRALYERMKKSFKK